MKSLDTKLTFIIVLLLAIDVYLEYRMLQVIQRGDNQ